MELSPHGLTPGLWIMSIRSLVEDGTPKEPALIQCSTPHNEHPRLALKLFRGEPAIAEFDWNFSANHSSSPSVERLVGSVLPTSFDGVQPGHG